MILIWNLFSEDNTLVCENVTLAMDYILHWKGNGITSITLTHTVGTIPFNNSSKYLLGLHMIWFTSLKS